MDPTELLPVLGGLAAGVLLALAGSWLYLRARKRTAAALLTGAAATAAETLRKATADAEQARAAAALEGKMEALRLREEGEREIARRREEADRADRRAEEREKASTRRAEQLEQQERAVTGRLQALERQEVAVKARHAEIEELVREEQARLERVAGLTTEDARRELLKRVEDEARAHARALAREIREQAKKDAERDAKKIIALAAQRLAAEHTAETTVAAVALPSDEMKGRIIGREGRNIRAFEQATGVDLIIDDTPDTVVVSCFDPIRREIGRRALEALIVDGRIHPGRIEEIVRKIRTELEGPLDRPDEVPHQLRAEHLRSLQGSVVARRDDGGRAASRRGAGQAGRAPARRRQGPHPRQRGHPRRAGRRGGPQIQRERPGDRLHPRPPRRRPPRDGRVGPGAGRRRHQRLPARRPPRGVRDLREAAHQARGDRRGVRRGGEDQRDPGRPGGPGDRGAREDRRRAGERARRDHRAPDRNRAAVPGADQGHRHPGDPRGRRGPVSARVLDGAAIARAIRDEVARDVAELKRRGVEPGLAVVIVGDDPASRAYVKSKGDACREAGMHSEQGRLPPDPP